MSGNARSLGLFNPYIVLLSHTLPTVYCKCIVLYSNSFRVPKKCQSSLILHSVGVRPDPGASGCRWGSIQTKHLPRELNQIVDWFTYKMYLLTKRLLTKHYLDKTSPHTNCLLRKRPAQSWNVPQSSPFPNLTSQNGHRHKTFLVLNVGCLETSLQPRKMCLLTTWKWLILTATGIRKTKRSTDSYLAFGLA